MTEAAYKQSARPAVHPAESEASMNARLLRAALAAILVCAVSGAGLAQGAARLKLTAGTPRTISPRSTPKVRLIGVGSPERVLFRWMAVEAGKEEKWGDATPGEHLGSDRFRAPAPGGEERRVWRLRAEENGATSDCAGVFTINSYRGQGLVAMESLGEKGIAVGYPNGRLGENLPISIRESGLMLKRALISTQPATASPSARPASLLVDRGIWTERDAAAYAAGSGGVLREDFAKWVGRLLAADDPTIPASKEPLDVVTEKGIVKGYRGEGYSWKKPVTRGEAAIILDRALAEIGEPTG